MDEKKLERAINKDETQVKNYILRSKICQSGYMEHVNEMIKAERTYADITSFLEAKGVSVTPAQISKHKKMLPYLTEVEFTPDNETEVGKLEATKDRFIKEKELTNVELAIETLQKTVQSSQILAVNELWGEIIPQMITNIKNQVADGYKISFKDTIDGLDKIVKIAQLLENKPTVIQAATVNGKTEVEHKHEHTIESIGDGSAESVSNAALEAMSMVNEALAKYANNKPIIN